MQLTLIKTLTVLATSSSLAYLVYAFFNALFREPMYSKRNTRLCYLAYGIIGFFLSLFGIPLLNLTYSITAFFSLTFLYEGKLKTKIFSVLIFYITAMIVDECAYTITKSYGTNYQISAGILSTLFMFFLVQIYKRYFMKKTPQNFAFAQWVIIICIPIGSIAIILLMFFKSFSQIYVALVSTILLLINMCIFYFFDVLNQYYEKEQKFTLLESQNLAYKKQMEIIKEGDYKIATLRHDLKNHMISLTSLLENQDNLGAIEYINKIMNYIKPKSQYVSTGNPDFDGIVNYKLNEMKKLNTKISVNVTIPSQIKITPFDLSVILGNLLDNSLDALKNQDGERTFHLLVKNQKNLIYILTENTFNGVVKTSAKKLLTTKQDKMHHGIGLENVAQTVKKYNGFIDTEIKSTIFITQTVIFVPK